jgi:hypothetical protein
MGNCYIFNTANTVLEVTLNEVSLGKVPPTSSSDGYIPQSIVTGISRYRDSMDSLRGSVAISEPNLLSLAYPMDPDKMVGSFDMHLSFDGMSVSVDDNVLIFVFRVFPSAARVLTMNCRGSIFDNVCRPSEI